MVQAASTNSGVKILYRSGSVDRHSLCGADSRSKLLPTPGEMILAQLTGNRGPHSVFPTQEGVRIPGRGLGTRLDPQEQLVGFLSTNLHPTAPELLLPPIFSLQNSSEREQERPKSFPSTIQSFVLRLLDKNSFKQYTKGARYLPGL